VILSTGQVQQLWAEMETTTMELAAEGELFQAFLKLHTEMERNKNTIFPNRGKKLKQ